MSKKPTIDFISLGCSKNLVDSEMLMGLFQAHGYHVTHDADHREGEIAVVNTCGFIEDAKQESIDTILELAQEKEQGRLKQLYVMGCLSERYLADLEREIPEVDGWYGKFNYKELLGVISKNAECGVKNEECTSRYLTTPPHYTYIKISEGCDRHCAYCAIPLITGHHQSRPIDEVLDEVRSLVARGVKEFNVIAQELTYYGVDLYGEQRIAELVERMADIEGVRWIRLHYAYPTNFPWNLLRVMRERDNVCKYLDIALQHSSDNMLERMRRHITNSDTRELIERMRREVPGICLRTTLMVGFPGETDDDFQSLLDFVRWAKFERMGAFAYSEEEGTYAAEHYTDDVPADVKQSRLDRLMRAQQRIVAEQSEQLLDKQRLMVIVDRKEGDYYVCRSQYSSPEVDPEILVHESEGTMQVGEFYDVLLHDWEAFDFYARLLGRHQF